MTTVTTARSRSLIRRAAAVGAAVAALAAGCSDGGREPATKAVRLDSITPVAALTPLESCDGLLGHFQGEALDRVGPYGLEETGLYGPTDDWFLAEGDVVALESELGSSDGAARDVPSTTAGPSGSAVSGTNVQVPGIDEPDLVKTDGERMIIVNEGQLAVVDLSGTEPTVAGRLDLPSGFDHELLVAGDRALVLTRDGHGDYLEDDMVIGSEVPTTSLTEVDLSDLSAPSVTRTLQIESSYVSARMQGAVARIVVSSPGPNLGFVYPAEPNEAAEKQAEMTNRSVIEQSTLDDWLPRWSIEGEDAPRSGRSHDCDAVHRPAEFAGFGLVSILTVDLATGLGEPDPVSVIGAGDTVYASADHLYVATERLADEPTAEPSDSSAERAVDIAPEPLDLRTTIHRFAAPAAGPVGYEASGEVEGRLLNQFALSEHEGVLRVATTRGEPWFAEGSDSLVTTLEAAGNQLVELGRVEDLGRGEQIFAVRFVGPVGYVVTFRQTDPLYVIDLGDPSEPVVEGELEILGYSAYLHPIDDTHVLGVGQDADESGSTSGTQVSLFDVSDPMDPVRTAQVTVPGGSSEVEWDHRAFLWWAPTGTAIVPVEQYQADGGNEAVAIAVDPESGALSEQGRVDHGSSPVRRSVVIDDTLVTLDVSGLVFSTLSDLSRQGDLPI